MPMLDHECSVCKYTDEYIVGATVKNQVPAKCPKCGNGTMEPLFSVSGQSFDVIGGYQYTHGKKRTLVSAEERSKCLTRDANGKYKDPY